MTTRWEKNRFLTGRLPEGWESAGEDPREDPREFHRSLPGYAPTPLVELPSLAKEFGVARLAIKDESKRFGLNAFKVLGASWAVHRFMRGKSGSFTFATATDGNHGRAVAWSAKRLGQKAVIFVPSNTVKARIAAIQGEGAEVVVVDGTYDETVKRAAADAAKNGWQVISDTAYPGYVEIPRWIMEGYLTLFREIESQSEGEWDVCLLQAGVGGLACAGALHFRRAGKKTVLLSVEPTDADCLAESIASPDGSMREARGKQNSIMAGLNCGTPSMLAWPVIRATFAGFLAVDDSWAEDAMKRLAKTGVVSGESGAAGLAGLAALCTDPALAAARRESALAPDARVLLVSTEGDTDPANYRRIVGS